MKWQYSDHDLGAWVWTPSEEKHECLFTESSSISCHSRKMKNKSSVNKSYSSSCSSGYINSSSNNSDKGRRRNKIISPQPWINFLCDNVICQVSYFSLIAMPAFSCTFNRANVFLNIFTRCLEILAHPTHSEDLII